MYNKKVVLISGGSDGLGKAIAQKIAVKYHTVILSPTKEKIEQVSGEIGCDFEICDVSDWKSVKQSVNKIHNKFGRIDCLINNAALWVQGELEQNDPEWINRVVQVNTTGVMFLTKAVIPVMKSQHSGLIIMINSQGGLYAKAERSVYTATKWALTGLTKSLQSELAKYGIAVSGIYPGKMNTEMFSKMGIKKDMNDALETGEVAKVIEFLLESNNKVVFPEIGIKNIEN